MNGILEFLTTQWSEAWKIWMDGGKAMIAIYVIGFIMFLLGLNVLSRLWNKAFSQVDERTLRRWIEHPTQRRGHVGRLLNFVMGGRTMKDMITSFEELEATEIAPFERDLRVMKICVSAAPLVGLLGTVMGMLATFSALSTGSGGDKTMAEVAGGISEALITTMTGLVIALPGLFFQHLLVRMHDRYKSFLAHLQTVCTQKLFKQLQAEELPFVAPAASYEQQEEQQAIPA